MAALICFVAVVVSAGESFWIIDQKLLRVQTHTDICMQITNLYSQKHIVVQLI